MDGIKERVLMILVNAMLNQLTPELLKTFADKTLDLCKVLVSKTDTQWDDAIFAKIEPLVRNTFDIED